MKEDRRSAPLFPIGIVMDLTQLSARQIRYYEEHNLVSPTRTKGNRRLFSFNDVDKLLEIKDLLDQTSVTNERKSNRSSESKRRNERNFKN